MNQSNNSHDDPSASAVMAVAAFMSKSKLYSTVLIILLFILGMHLAQPGTIC